jgi:phosphoglycerate dehydrogenase-like enzyme
MNPMKTLLCTMPERTYHRMGLPDYEAELRGLGNLNICCNAHELSEDAYGALWEGADAVLTGWGSRAPTPAMLARANHLSVVSHTAGSIRWLPREALVQGIVVTNAQAAIARTVAEYCLLHTLLLLRRGVGKSGRPETLYGKTVGLVGFGHVGRLFRLLLAPFGVRVLVSDPALGEDEAARLGVERADLPTLLHSCRVVSLHAPDIPATRGLIGAAELEQLCDGAILLNSARGRLIDTEALTQALHSGRFFAVLDVTEPEPLLADHPLRAMLHVLLTPHIAGPTDDELPQMTRMALTDLSHVLRGDPPLHPVSLETYDGMSF